MCLRKEEHSQIIHASHPTKTQVRTQCTNVLHIRFFNLAHLFFFNNTVANKNSRQAKFITRVLIQIHIHCLNFIAVAVETMTEINNSPAHAHDEWMSVLFAEHKCSLP